MYVTIFKSSFYTVIKRINASCSVVPCDLSVESLKQAGKKSFEIAKASAMVAGEELPFAEVPVVEDTYTTPHEENPFSVSSSNLELVFLQIEKLSMLLKVS